MEILGLVNVVIFVLLLVKCGIGRGIGYMIGNFFIVGFFGFVAWAVVSIFTANMTWGSYAAAAAEIVVTLIRMKTALDDINRR